MDGETPLSRSARRPGPTGGLVAEVLDGPPFAGPACSSRGATMSRLPPKVKISDFPFIPSFIPSKPRGETEERELTPASVGAFLLRIVAGVYLCKLTGNLITARASHLCD
jgi:hypothetical protein